MGADDFDRFARAFGDGLTRRGVIALLSGFVAVKTRAASAVQLGPAACGQSGAVCTMIMGCCEGLTCVTSAINVNYGVCVPGGSGGTVAATTSLISPQSEGVVDQLAGATTETSATTSTTSTTTDKEAEKQARIAQRKARKNAHRSRIRSRRDDQQAKRDDQRERRLLRRGPSLNVDLFFRGDGAEELSVTNQSNRSAVLTKITVASDTKDGTSLNKTISSGQTYSLLSGLPLDTEVQSDEFFWRDQAVCTSASAGFVLSASFSTDLENKNYTILCDGSISNDGGAGSGHHKHRRRHRDQRRSQQKRKSEKRKQRKRR